MKINNCLICKSDQSNLLFQIEKVTVFANLVYPDLESALNAPTGSIDLCQCTNCGFIYNKTHDFSLMAYNPNYDNQQTFSTWYQNYLRELVELIEKNGGPIQRIVEVGCGKGNFLELFKQKGYEIKGFDPTYEGNNPDIIRDYFTEKYASFNADIVLLRHTIDAVEDPCSLIQLIAKANNFKGKIYIETPDFDWAFKNNAITDVLYEHTCYFTKSTISKIFNSSIVGNLFGGQYLYCIGDLSDLAEPPYDHDFELLKAGNFDEEIAKYHKIIAEDQELVVWGAGGKGVSFVSAVDPEKKHVKFLIDIYPNKQNKFTGVTGHKILSPEEGLKRIKEDKIAVLVSNPNYLEEVRALINDPEVKLITW